jgi:hypothetical protein
MSKNPTYWLPQSGFGYVVPQNALHIVTNLGQPLVTNLDEYIVPNLYYVVGKYATAWSQI